MFGYIWKDMTEALQYYPYGLAAGCVFFALFLLLKRKKRGPFLGKIVFVMYMAILLCMTLLFRESGSGKEMDFELFSTWGINTRNNALVIENVILFVPYGFVCAWAFPKLRRFISCVAIGCLTSVSIELIQYATQRGFFQIDDILTNIIGAALGFIIFSIVHYPFHNHQADK